MLLSAGNHVVAKEKIYNEFANGLYEKNYFMWRKIEQNTLANSAFAKDRI
jgi:hypothetical protein